MQFFCTCISKCNICNILQLFRLTVTLWIMFIIVIALSRFDEKLPLVLQSAAILIKFLYNMVLDTFDRYRYMFFVVYFYKKNNYMCIVKFVKCINVFLIFLLKLTQICCVGWYLKYQKWKYWYMHAQIYIFWKFIENLFNVV